MANPVAEDNNNQQGQINNRVDKADDRDYHFPAETYSKLNDAPAESCPGPDEATDDHFDI
ncbi:hypothetical protein N7488_010973 [Penicillium malachiteum]|nr:hypothetical protein N7488_010973 [Penicillium malachiteum]